MSDHDITLSPLYQAGGPDAGAIQASLRALADSRASVNAAAATLRTGQISGDDRDNLLADVLGLYDRLVGLILGRPA
jgi:hypothetical protein